jgi:iron complex outermembrane recepter protein
VGAPIYENFPYLNAGETKTSGIDVDLRSRFDIGSLGTLAAEFNYTYISQYELLVNGGLFDLAGTHGPTSISGDTGNPRQRAVASLTWEQGPVTATLSANYTGTFKITDPSAVPPYLDCLTAINLSGVGYGAALPLGAVSSLPSQWKPFCSVNHFTSFNLYAAYAASDHLSFHASVRNLFNTQPPIDLQTYGGGALYRYTTLDQDGAVGRFFLVGASYKF